MIYVMNAKLYWSYINDEKGRAKMKHNELIAYLNRNLNLRGRITELHIKK